VTVTQSLLYIYQIIDQMVPPPLIMACVLPAESE